ncbi:MAG: hypothetical protein JO202_04030 [Ktedonobacteraceae bacterium]|nr:hypothetical protein [Ktedonobacteraceae bacterium]
MSKEVKAAIITTIGGIIVAIITVILGPVITKAPTTVAPTPTSGPIPVVTSVVPTATSAPITPTQSPYGATATQTMNAFCTDLYGGYYQSAYNLFSPQFQARETEQTFASNYYKALCGNTKGFTQSQNGGEQTGLSILYPNGVSFNCTYYLSEQDGGWAIDDSVCQRVS